MSVFVRSNRWKHHARAYDQRAPVTFGPPPQIGTKFIALDLEYVNAGQIWAVANLLVYNAGLPRGPLLAKLADAVERLQQPQSEALVHYF